MDNEFIMAGWKYRNHLATIEHTSLVNKQLSKDQIKSFLVGYFDKDTERITIEEVYNSVVKLNPIINSVERKDLFIAITTEYIIGTILKRRLSFIEFTTLNSIFYKEYKPHKEENIKSIW